MNGRSNPVALPAALAVIFGLALTILAVVEDSRLGALVGGALVGAGVVLLAARRR